MEIDVEYFCDTQPPEKLPQSYPIPDNPCVASLHRRASTILNSVAFLPEQTIPDIQNDADDTSYNATAMLASLHDGLLLHRYFSKLLSSSKIQRRHRLRELEAVVRSYMNISQEKDAIISRLCKKCNAQNKLLQDNVVAYSAADEKATDLKTQLVNARENFTLEQIDTDSVQMKLLDSEIHNLVSAPSGELQMHCTACLLPAKSRRRQTELAASSPVLGVVQGRAKFNLCSPRRKRELICSQLILYQRRHIAALQGARSDAAEKRLTLEDEAREIYRAVVADVQISRKLRTIFVRERAVPQAGNGSPQASTILDHDPTAFHPENIRLLSAATSTTQLFNTNLMYCKKALVALKEMVRRFMTDVTLQVCESAGRMLQVSHAVNQSVLTSEPLLAAIKTFAMRFGSITQTSTIADTPEDSQSDTSRPAAVLQRNVAVFEGMLTTVAELVRVAPLQDRQQIMGQDGYDVPPPESEEDSDTATSSTSTSTIAESLPEAASSDTQQDLPPSGEDAVPTIVPKRKRRVRARSPKPPKNATPAPKPKRQHLRHAKTNTTGFMSRSCQTDRLPSQSVHLRVMKESAGTQTEDPTQASCAVQTQPYWTASIGVGISTASTATAMSPDDFVTPGHIDGSSTTITTFCLAPSAALQASAAYTDVRYVCRDDVSTEAPLADDTPHRQDVSRIIPLLRGSLRKALERVDVLRGLIGEYRAMETLEVEEEEVEVEAVAPAPPLPRAVMDAVAEVESFSKELARSFLPASKRQPEPHPRAPPGCRRRRHHAKRDLSPTYPTHRAVLLTERRGRTAEVRHHTMPVLTGTPMVGR